MYIYIRVKKKYISKNLCDHTRIYFLCSISIGIAFCYKVTKGQVMLTYQKHLFVKQKKITIITLPYEASPRGIPCLKQSCCSRYVRVASLTINLSIHFR